MSASSTSLASSTSSASSTSGPSTSSTTSARRLGSHEVMCPSTHPNPYGDGGDVKDKCCAVEVADDKCSGEAKFCETLEIVAKNTTDGGVVDAASTVGVSMMAFMLMSAIM